MKTPNLWQSHDWENFQKALGHKALRLGSEGETALMIIHPLFLGLSYGYVPRGPSAELHQLGILLGELEQPAKHHRLVFTRIDPEQPMQIPANVSIANSASIQPEVTLLLDLTLTEQQLLEQMKRKGRYNINLSEKKGVRVERAEGENQRKSFCHEFYQLLKETKERDLFSAHQEAYYQTMLKTLRSSEIFIAWHDDRPIAGAICTFQSTRAIYYYGASGNQHRELMAPYLVQWEAIREAKRRGCTTYDFLGIAPEEALQDHPWKGITDFKRKFGGSVVHYPKPIDIIHRPFWYSIYRSLKFLQRLLKT
jgi:lipid II:glycine glycyltransferase (peptidoglycan interpeptide bridge formation enzyme)